MSIKHEEVVDRVLYPEWRQGGHDFRFVSVHGGYPEVQIKVRGHWFPVQKVIE